MSRFPLYLCLIAGTLQLSNPAQASLYAPPENVRPQSVSIRSTLEDRPVVDEKSAPTLENFSNNIRAGQTLDTDGAAVRVGSVQVETQADIDHGIFQTAIEPFLGNKATQGDLAKLAQKIADVARAKGMVLADAYIPAQSIEMGMVKVILTVGVIDEVRIVGSKSRALRNLLAPLEGMARMGNELERRLLLANAIPQIYVDKTELVTEGDRRVLVVKVTEVKKLSGQLAIDNLGSNDIGPLRARLSMDAVDLIDSSDSLNVTLRTNPADPDELAVASAVYGVAVNNEGTRAEIAAAWSDSNIAPRSGFDRRNGTSAYGSFSVNHPVRRSATANLWMDAQFEYLKVEQNVSRVLVQSDTAVTASFSLSSSTRLHDGWLRAGTQIRQGLDIFSANKFGDSVASRSDADGVFTVGRAWASWSGKASGNITLRVAASGQIASGPLLSLEEMGIGGAFVGRAFEFYEFSGENGIMGLAEIGYALDRPVKGIKRLQPYIFVDGGHVRNLNGGFGGGTLCSAGSGLRADVGRFSIQLEAALPVYASPQGETNSSLKFNFQLGMRF